MPSNMSNSALDSAGRATAQETVIEICSDDSDDSDIDLDSESDGESDATNADKKVPDSSDASSTKSRLFSPSTTATTGSSSLTASQYSHPSSVSQSFVEDSASEAENLTQILKTVRKARAQEASEEQLAPEPALPLPDLSAEIRASFGDRIKSTSNFFAIDQPSRPIPPQPGTSSEDRTRSVVDGVSKRKAPYDPFAEDLLNIENIGSVGLKKKRRHDKKRDCPRTTSQAAHGNTRQQGSGHDSTCTASQDPKGQRHETSCFEPKSAADGRSSRALSLGVKLPVRPRSASVDSAAMRHRRCKGNLNLLVDSRDTGLSAVCSKQPSHLTHDNCSSQKVIIDLDEDDGHEPVRLPGTHLVAAESDTQRVQVIKRQSVKETEKKQHRSGSGIHSLHNSRRRSPETRIQFRNVSAGISQTQPDDLQGRIGGRPERRPAYAQKETSRLDKVIRKASSRQLGSGRVAKWKTLQKPPSQRPRTSASPAAEARLLEAQGTSTWRAAPLHSAGKGSQRTRHASHSELAAKSRSAPLFRPNKNAYAFERSVIGDDEDNDSDQGRDQVPVQASYNLGRNLNHQPLLDVDEVEDEAEFGAGGPPQSSADSSAYLPNRISRLPIRPSSYSNRSSMNQPVRRDNGRLAGNQRRNVGTYASKASHQAQLPVEDWDQTAKQMAALRKQYEDKPRALVVDALPSSFGMSDPAEIRQHNKILDRERAKLRYDSSNAEKQRRQKAISLCKARKAAITRNVRKEFGHMSEHFQNEEIERRYNAYFEKHHSHLSQPSDHTVVRGVQFNEAFLENGHSDNDVQNDPDDDLNKRTIPASEALRRLEPLTRLTIFTVFVSEPHEEGEENPKFKINKSFDMLTEANKHARSILNKSLASLETDWESKCVDGFAIGKWKIPAGIHKGKWRSIKTQEEETWVGDLPPDALRDKCIDEELIEKYARDAYDVFFVRLAPEDYWEAEAPDENNAGLGKQQEESGRGRQRKRRGILGEHAANFADDNGEAPASFEGDGRRQALAAGPSGPCQSIAEQESIVDGEDPASDNATQSSDDSDSSEGTVCAPRRPGIAYNQVRGNAYSVLRPKTEVLGTFTTMLEANKAALSAARSKWKPRTPDMNANIMYTEKVLPYIESQEEHVHSEEMKLQIPGLGSATGRDLISWGFTCSEIFVNKRDLQGPMNLEIGFTLTARDGKQAASASKKAVRAAEDMDQAMVEGEEHGEILAQAAVEGEEGSMGRSVTEIEQHGEMNAAAVAEGEDEEDRSGQGHEVVEGLDKEMPDRQPSDESEVSEEE